MSHEDIAEVWSLLSGRQDVDNVLRELIGTHYLTVSLARRDHLKLREAFLSHIVTLRVIFDLQRTYLQSSIRSPESISSLLSRELLFSAVLHLLDVIVTGCITCSDLSTEEPYNRLTAHATLAGLRTLLLQKKSLTAREYDLLNSRFEEIYERGHWHGTGYTLTLRICRQAIQALASPVPNVEYAEPACCTASMPDFFNGLVSYLRSVAHSLLFNSTQFLFQDYETSLMDASRNIGIISLQSLNWFGHFLTLYDLFWSTTAALIQLCQLRRQVPGTATEPHYMDRAEALSNLRLILSIRYRLQRHAFSPSGGKQSNWASAQFLALMLQDMRQVCADERCKCFEPDSSIAQEMVPHLS